MNYKGGYQPSDLLDPETYQWYPMKECKKLLDKKNFAVFSAPEKNYDKEENQKPVKEVDEDEDEDKVGDDDRIPGTLKLDQIKPRDVHNTRVLLQKKETCPVSNLVAWYNSQEFRDIILEYIAVVGPDLTKRLVIDF